MDKSQEIHVGHIIFSSKWEWIAQRNKGIAKPHCLSSFLAPPPFFPFSTSPGRVVFAWQTDRDTCGTLHWAVAPLRGPNHFQTHTRARTQMVRSRNTAGVWPNLATLRTRYTGSENNEGGCCPLPLIQISALLHLPSLLMCIEPCIISLNVESDFQYSLLYFPPKPDDPIIVTVTSVWPHGAKMITKSEADLTHYIIHACEENCIIYELQWYREVTSSGSPPNHIL